MLVKQNDLCYAVSETFQVLAAYSATYLKASLLLIDKNASSENCAIPKEFSEKKILNPQNVWLGECQKLQEGGGLSNDPVKKS